jgi:hypothetical protein
MRINTPAYLAAFAHLVSAQVIPIQGVDFTITNFSFYQASQQAYQFILDLSLNDTLVDDVVVPGFSAHCEASFYPGSTYDHVTGERTTEVAECNIRSSNPLHAMVAVHGYGAEIWYYFYSPEK